MKRATLLLAGLGIVVGTAFAHPEGMQHGQMMGGMGPMAGMHGGDAQFQADMRLVHEMLASYRTLKRSVANLPDGIRTVTESDDPSDDGGNEACRPVAVTSPAATATGRRPSASGSWRR
jgi:hypothetical protein